MYNDLDDIALLELAIRYLVRSMTIPDDIMEALKERELDDYFTETSTDEIDT
jgi:hypothetical protein